MSRAPVIKHIMSLHLVKLCVGASSVEDLQAWIDHRLGKRRRMGRSVEQTHTTRMIPKRASELLDGGSLYWVIKGNIQLRQQLLDIRPFTDGQGIRRCDLLLHPELVLTCWHPRRAFQGWRYLKPEEAPADLGGTSSHKALPPELHGELAVLGLL